MSKFLAPIHSWLFNKIKISEGIENRLLETLQVKEDPFVKALYSQVGPQLPDSPLEELIDQSNIHGWLQNRIHMTESRLAALITWQVTGAPENLSMLHSIWTQAGAALGGSLESPPPLKAEEAYKLVQDIVLEGMPCDRVNQVTAVNEEAVEWLTTQCLHQGYFQAVNGEVAHYYDLRKSFVNGLFSTIQPCIRYEVTAQPAGSGSAYHNQITIQ